MKPMLPGRKIKSGLFLLVVIVVAIIATSLFFPKVLFAQSANCDCSPEIKAPSNRCSQGGTSSCVVSAGGYSYGWRIEDGQCYEMAWLCGRSLNPGICSCSNVATTDYTANFNTRETCVGVNGAFATCAATSTSGISGVGWRWENGRCFRDYYTCPSVISSFSPSCGARLAEITISGSDFGTIRNTIALISQPSGGVANIAASDILTWTASSIVFKISAGFPNGTYKIKVINSGGKETTSSGNLTVSDSCQATCGNGVLDAGEVCDKAKNCITGKTSDGTDGLGCASACVGGADGYHGYPNNGRQLTCKNDCSGYRDGGPSREVPKCWAQCTADLPAATARWGSNDVYVGEACPSGGVMNASCQCVSSCPWDIIKTGTSNGKVDGLDLAELNRCYSPLGGVGAGCEAADLNHNGVINALDYSLMIMPGHWGNCP